MRGLFMKIADYAGFTEIDVLLGGVLMLPVAAASDVED